MLCEKIDSQSYMEDFKKRFVNFVEKSPVKLSIIITPTEVQVIDEYTQQGHAFTWDFSIPVKSFIHGIKQNLVERCYPVNHKVEHIEVPVSEKEQIELASKGLPLDNIPTRVYKKRVTEYLIDKVVIYKDMFILVDRATGQSYRYKLNKSSVFFLKDLRSKKFNRETAGDFFFANATLMNEIHQKESF